MNRREFVKSAALAGASTIPFIAGCGKKGSTTVPLIDRIISGLKVADSVTQALEPIILPISSAIAGLLTTMGTDIELVVKTYEDYDKGGGTDATKVDLIRSTGAAIQSNLSGILNAIDVKNVSLRALVTTAVAVVNTSIIAVLAVLPTTTTTARAAMISTLPTVGDSSPAGLKKAWNDAVAVEHPGSKI